jgi:hypothetical protein
MCRCVITSSRTSTSGTAWTGTGRCLDYDQTGPEALAQAIAAGIGRPVSYRPVETDGAARAAALLSELI